MLAEAVRWCWSGLEDFFMDNIECLIGFLEVEGSRIWGDKDSKTYLANRILNRVWLSSPHDDIIYFAIYPKLFQPHKDALIMRALHDENRVLRTPEHRRHDDTANTNRRRLYRTDLICSAVQANSPGQKVNVARTLRQRLEGNPTETLGFLWTCLADWRNVKRSIDESGLQDKGTHYAIHDLLLNWWTVFLHVETQDIVIPPLHLRAFVHFLSTSGEHLIELSHIENWCQDIETTTWDSAVIFGQIIQALSEARRLIYSQVCRSGGHSSFLELLIVTEARIIKYQRSALNIMDTQIDEVHVLVDETFTYDDAWRNEAFECQDVDMDLGEDCIYHPSLFPTSTARPSVPLVLAADMDEEAIFTETNEDVDPIVSFLYNPGNFDIMVLGRLFIRAAPSPLEFVEVENEIFRKCNQISQHRPSDETGRWNLLYDGFNRGESLLKSCCIALAGKTDLKGLRWIIHQVGNVMNIANITRIILIYIETSPWEDEAWELLSELVDDVQDEDLWPQYNDVYKWKILLAENPREDHEDLQIALNKRLESYFSDT